MIAMPGVSQPAVAQACASSPCSGSSVLDTSATPISGGAWVFNDTSALNATTALGVSGGGQFFYNSAMLNASASNALSGGTQEFYNSAVLNASAANAVSGGGQTFHNTSVLNASVSNAVSGGAQYFFNSTVINVTATNGVSGGNQYLSDTSVLNASVANALSGGFQHLAAGSVLNATVADAVSGGNQYFDNNSVLNASAAGAVSGGLQDFFGSSRLNASVANAISGGDQYLWNTAALNASASNAVSGGRQLFSNSSVLNASAANAVSGGLQYFYDTTSLNANVANAVSGGTQTFRHGSALSAAAANSVSGGTQIFRDTSTLNASVANSVSGGTQNFRNNSELNATAANAVSGGTQNFINSSTLSASVAHALSGGVQAFRDTSMLSAAAADAVSGGTITLYQAGTFWVGANQATTRGAHVSFDNSAGGAGGMLQLNGYSTTLGAIQSAVAGSGIIRNGGATNATLTIDGTDRGDSTFSGVIENGGAGTLALVKAGTGTLTLSGTNTYTGGTSVTGGTLVVNGSITGTTVVQAGGTLGGSGTVGALTVHGTLAPGNSPGTLNVAGPLAFAAGSTYAVEVQGAVADRIHVTGTATIAAGTTLQVTGLGGAYSFGTPYTILSTTGGLTGTFSTLNLVGTGLRIRDSYDANNAYLTLSRASLATLVAASSRNARAVAGGLDVAGDAGADLSGLIPIYALSGDALSQALGTLSGDVHTTIAPAGFREMTRFGRIMSQGGGSGATRAFVPDRAANGARTSGRGDPVHTGSLPSATGWTLWGAAYGGLSRTGADARTGTRRQDETAFGMAGGFERGIGRDSHLGFAFAAGSARSSAPGGHGSADMGVYQFGVYGGTKLGAATLSGSLSYGLLGVNTSRTVPALGVSAIKADYVGHMVNARVEASAPLWSHGGFTLSPVVAGQVMSVSTPRFTEKGAAGGAALSVAARTQTNLRSELGARFTFDTTLGGNATRFTTRLAWAYDTHDKSTVHAQLVNFGGAAFTTSGSRRGHHSALISTGIETELSATARISAELDADLSRRASSIAGRAKFQLKF
ncbi:MAG: autotransporter domain-containing protein [Proteobacteria bacterium]|nr:autotransporter domain-containing protein [Pseudomonadota bacterium]